MIPVTPAEIDLAIELAMKAQEALQNFMTKGLPILQQASDIIKHMQATGKELPTAEEIAALKATAAQADLEADAAIKNAEGGSSA